MLFRLFLASLLMVGSSALLPAQNMNRRALQQQPQQFGRQQPVEVHGVIENAMRNGITVAVDGANQRFHIAIPAAAKVEVSGKATVDYLQTGQIVEFQTEIENHLIKGKVGQLSVVALSPDKQMGIFPPPAPSTKAVLASTAAASPPRAPEQPPKSSPTARIRSSAG